MKLLLLTLIFAGFQIQDNLAFGPDSLPFWPHRPIQDCFSKNKCLKDEHCGKEGKCVKEKYMGYGLAFTNTYYKTFLQSTYV